MIWTLNGVPVYLDFGFITVFVAIMLQYIYNIYIMLQLILHVQILCLLVYECACD